MTLMSSGAGEDHDAMATEKLASGIRDFAADQVKLEQLLQDSGG